jgi:hypothetical protein
VGQYFEIEDIRDFDTLFDRSSSIVHYGKHFGEDLSGVETPDEYLALARELAISASRGDPGTEVSPRGLGNEFAIFVDTALSQRHSYYGGIFLVVRYEGSSAVLKTMFAPQDGRAYFDADIRKNRRLL